MKFAIDGLEAEVNRYASRGAVLFPVALLPVAVLLTATVITMFGGDSPWTARGILALGILTYIGVVLLRRHKMRKLAAQYRKHLTFRVLSHWMLEVSGEERKKRMEQAAVALKHENVCKTILAMLPYATFAQALKTAQGERRKRRSDQSHATPAVDDNQSWSAFSDDDFLKIKHIGISGNGWVVDETTGLDPMGYGIGMSAPDTHNDH
jgi:hypothetical protein